MGELYMDNIDKALAREHARCHDGYSLQKEAKAIESLVEKQTALEHLVQTSAHHDKDVQPEPMLSGIF